MSLAIDAIAMVCHETNRAYCASIGDTSQVPWGDAPEWQRLSAVEGVQHALDGDVTPEESHANWMRSKEADGWVEGPTKDEVAKTHPCMVPYAELPIAQRRKDYLFIAVVRALATDHDTQ